MAVFISSPVIKQRLHLGSAFCATGAWAKMPAEEIPWNDPLQHVFHVPEKGDVQVKILCGLAGIRPTRVAVSSLNDGNIVNLEDGIAAEFTHIVDETGLHLVKGLRIPTGVLGMVGSLAIHQTLLAKACGTGGAKDLYEALLAYPTGFDTEAARKLSPAFCQKAVELVLETDYKMKTSFDDKERLLEFLILQLAQEARNG